MMSRKQTPEINAGSMADIAFLLLIFFLVTTTMNVDSGILKKIPEKNLAAQNTIIKDKNILEILINKNNELFVEGNIINLKDLKQTTIDFIDNGGGRDKNGKNCNWCSGKQLPNSSDHPSKAFIAIKTDRATSYATYISTLDNINAAYTLLRNKLAVKYYQQNYASLLEEFQKSNYTNATLENQIKTIREKYPLLISDAENLN